MKIVVLDGFGLNPGDLSWDGFSRFGEVIIYDRTAPQEVLERSRHAAVLLTNKTVISEKMLSQLPECRYIGVLATGYNVVNIAAARNQGVVVTNIPAYSTSSVAQLVFAHLLNIVNQVDLHATEVRKGRWNENKDFCFWDSPQTELANKTIGLIGLGNTGMATARIAHAFGMNVIAYTSKRDNEIPDFIRSVSYEKLFSTSDVISLHCPLTDSTKGLINKEKLALMKPSAILINTGRGPLIEEEDLAEALRTGIIAAAGLDVLSQEPPRNDNPLIPLSNCFITPHIAWATFEARRRLMQIAEKNLEAFLGGNPINNIAI